MNWLLLVVIAVLIIYAWRGRKRGFIRTVFTIFSTIVAIGIALWINPYVTNLVKSNDTLMNYVNEKVDEALMSEEQPIISEDTGGKTTDEVEYINNLPIPSILKETLIESKTPDVYAALAVNNFRAYIINMISVFLINLGTFLAICLLTKIILSIISNTLDLIANLPIISGLNRATGLLAGIVHGMMVVWVGFIVITLFANYEIGQYLFTLINQSEILSAIYNNNIILIILTDIGKVLF